MRKVFPQAEWATDDKGLHVRKVYRLERYTGEKGVPTGRMGYR